MKDLTVIIPVDKLDEVTKPLYENALKSVVDAQGEDTIVIVVGPKEELAKVNPGEYKNVTFVLNEDINLPKQINVAVNEVKTKCFSVLEYDDVFTKKWFNNVEKWMEANPGFFVYLPIDELIDAKKEGKAVGYLNEPVWASSFSEKLGYFDTDSLMNYVNINCTGGVFDKDAFVEIGGLKESIKLCFWYELLLRAVYKQKTVYVVPKIGYKHTINRDGSLTDQYTKSMSEKEADWWINLAREEYFFKKDRNKTYQE